MEIQCEEDLFIIHDSFRMLWVEAASLQSAGILIVILCGNAVVLLEHTA